MRHPGNEAFASLVSDAEKRNIVITSGNSPLTKLKNQYVAKGFGYAGVDLYEGGKLTAQMMIENGKLKSRRSTVCQGSQSTPAPAWSRRAASER